MDPEEHSFTAGQHQGRGAEIKRWRDANIAYVAGPKLYRKDYYCDVSDEGACRIELTLARKKKPAKRRRPRDEQLLDIYDFSKKKESE